MNPAEKKKLKKLFAAMQKDYMRRVNPEVAAIELKKIHDRQQKEKKK